MIESLLLSDMNIPNRLSVGILSLLLFVPTIISEELLFPFIAGKNLWFRLIVLVAGISFAYFIYKKRELIKTITPIHAAFAFFVGILLLADVLGVNPIRSLVSNFERMEGWFTHLLLFLTFCFLTQLVQNISIWRNIFKVSLIANAYVLFWGFSQYFGLLNLFQQTADRVDATLGNAAYFAGYAMMYCFIAVWLAYTTKNISARYLYGLIGFLNIFISFITLTRGAVLGFVGGVLITLTLITVFERRLVFMRFVVGGVLGLVLVTTVFLFSNKDSEIVRGSPVLSRIASISIKEHTATSRLLIWNMSLEGFKERPLLGWGQDNFLYVFSSHFDPRMGPYEPWYDRSHNVFFDWMVAGGTLGLLAYLALFIAPIYIMWFARTARSNFSVVEKSLWTGFLGAYFIFNLFVFDNIVSYVLFVFVLAYLTWKAFPVEKRAIITLSSQHVSVIVGVLLATSFIGIYFLVYKPFIGGTALIEGMRYAQAVTQIPTDIQFKAWTQSFIGNEYTREELSALAREKFKQATGFFIGRTEAREQLPSRLVDIVQYQNISDEEKREWMNFTFSEIQDELKRDQGSPRIYQIAGLLYLQFGRTQEAIQLLDRAQELSPKKQLIMFDRALAYQVLGDYEKSLALSKEAYDLNPAFLTAKAKYILALYRAGRDVEATALEQEFLQEAYVREYELVVNGTYTAQAKMAKVEFRGREAGAAYKRGDMSAYAKYYAEIKALDPDSALRLTEIVKSLK